MIELKAGSSDNAKWAIRHYPEIAAGVHRVERRRPRLVAHIVMDEATGVPLPLDKQPMMRVEKNKAAVTAYVEGKTILDIVTVVLAERLRERDAAIMTDICVNGVSAKEAAEKYDVSEKTVKRVRRRMEAAYDDEVNSRMLASEGLSRDHR